MLPVDENGSVFFTEVVESELEKSELISNVRSWIAYTFGNYDSVVQFEDLVRGRIILKGTINVEPLKEANLLGVYVSNSKDIIFALTLDIKDQKYRYIMSEIYSELNLTGDIRREPLSNHLLTIAEFEEEIKIISSSLDFLKRKDLTSLKRRELEEHEKMISTFERTISQRESAIQYHYDELEKEVFVIESLLNDLKESMIKKTDDF